jgi:prepilin-type N-terminal cleavage/methylation domain-containing protein
VALVAAAAFVVVRARRREVEVEAGAGRASLAAPVPERIGSTDGESMARDASGNRRARVAAQPEEKAPSVAASPGSKRSPHALPERDSIAATLRKLEEDLFWIQLLQPVCDMPAGQVDEAIRALAASPLAHPREGKRLYHPNVLRSRLDGVRHADVSELQCRKLALERELAELGPGDRSAGMTLVESLVVMALLGTAVAIGAAYLRPMEAPVERAADELQALLRGARARAVATTSAHRVRPETNGAILGEHAPSCAATSWTAEPGLDLALPDLVTLTDTAWSVCFNSRGIASTALLVTLDHPDFQPRDVEVMLGGAIRRVP